MGLTYFKRYRMEIDLGLDFPFVGEGVEIAAIGEMRIRENVEKLIAFTNAVVPLDSLCRFFDQFSGRIGVGDHRVLFEPRLVLQ